MRRTLAVEEVSYAYEAGRPVLTGVSAKIQGGELTGIVGANGSGKSTLLRVMCGVFRPQTGSVSLDGKPLRGLSRRARAQTLAFLPQTVNPAFALSAFEVVCLGRYPYTGALGGLTSRDLAVAEQCMGDTETDVFRDRDFMTLSGGERQRVLLASVLAQEPDILLLDEPTSALDIHHQIEFFYLLRRLASEGYGIAVVTHDLNLAARFCGHVLLLGAEKGLLASGSPEDVLTEPLLSRAYGAAIRVGENPLTGTPLICAEMAEDCP